MVWARSRSNASRWSRKALSPPRPRAAAATICSLSWPIFCRVSLTCCVAATVVSFRSLITPSTPLRCRCSALTTVWAEESTVLRVDASVGSVCILANELNSPLSWLDRSPSPSSL